MGTPKGCVSGEHSQDYGALCLLQDVHSFSVSHSLKTVSIHSNDLIATFQPAILYCCPLKRTKTRPLTRADQRSKAFDTQQWGSYRKEKTSYAISADIPYLSQQGRFSHLVEYSFDIDRQVSVRAAEPSYDAEAQAWWASLESNGFIHACPREQKAKHHVPGTFPMKVQCSKLFSKVGGQVALQGS